MGGFGTASGNTSELLTNNGTTEPSFMLHHYTTDACTIEADDWVVVTGGWYTRTNVTEYDINGWRQELPDLNTGRYDHGCGYYVNANKEIVYLVAGGFYVDENYVRTYLASTEILTNGGSRWMDVEPLPSGAIGLQGVSVDNKIFMTGGQGICHLDTILSFDIESHSWSMVGHMKDIRSFHGFSLVNVDDIVDYCNITTTY